MRNTKSSYITGYVLSTFLTLTTYVLVSIHVHHNHGYPSDTFMIIILPILAVVQMFVQMILFLHLGRDKKQKWNSYTFVFALITVLIIVGGSLWIMSNLNYRMMYSPKAINQYLHNEGDL